MNKARRKKKRRNARKRKLLAQRIGSRVVRLEVSGLEIARGHDGFLRGSPEPVLVCAVFSLVGHVARLIARGVGYFDNPDTYPCVVRASDPLIARGQRDDEHAESLAVFVVAMEEDRGTDIQRLYAALEREDHLQFLETSGEPRAVFLEDVLVHAGGWAHPHEVELLYDGTSFASSCAKDKWISAGLYCATSGTTRRLHFVSECKRNDWTAIVHLR